MEQPTNQPNSTARHATLSMRPRVTPQTKRVRFLRIFDGLYSFFRATNRRLNILFYFQYISLKYNITINSKIKGWAILKKQQTMKTSTLHLIGCYRRFEEKSCIGRSSSNMLKNNWLLNRHFLPLRHRKGYESSHYRMQQHRPLESEHSQKLVPLFRVVGYSESGARQRERVEHCVSPEQRCVKRLSEVGGLDDGHNRKITSNRQRKNRRVLQKSTVCLVWRTVSFCDKRCRHNRMLRAMAPDTTHADTHTTVKDRRRDRCRP